MKTLLITDVPPNRKMSGALLSWHCCKNFNNNNLLAFFIQSPEIGTVNLEFPFTGPVETITEKKHSERSFRPWWLPRRLRFIASFVREVYRKYVQVPEYGKHVLDLIEQKGADRVWIILQGQTMIWLAQFLIQSRKVPVHIQIWDAPTWWIKANSIDRFSAKMLMKSYNFCLKEAASVACPSFQMASGVQEKFKRPTQTLIGITPSEYVNRNAVSRNDGKIIIGFAGQIYATDTFSNLIVALDSTYWEIDGKKVEIHYWGNSHIPSLRTRIISKGYVSQQQLAVELSGCDILYCPYWFDPKFREEAETSFPSKLTTYLSSNAIVLFHGPEYSSPGKFLIEHKAAVCCFSRDEEVIKMNLRKALYLKERDQMISNAHKLVSTELSEVNLHFNFKQFMNLESNP